MSKRIYNLLVCILLTCLILSPAITVQAVSETLDTCVNLINVTKDEKGSGYAWNNRYDTLTLTDLNINTNDSYGLRLPDNATVILVGDNYIKSAGVGIECVGNTTFKGDGSLTIVSGDKGIYVSTTNGRKIVKFVSGKYDITAEKYAVYSLNVPVSFADCNINFVAGEAASLAYELSVNQVVIDSNSPLISENNLTISDSNLTINASQQALVSQKGSLKLNKMDMSSNGKAIENYNGESSIATKGNVEHYTKSVLFGAGVKIWVDYVLIISIILIIGAVIFAKVYTQKIKDKKKREEIEAIRKANMLNITKANKKKG